MNDPRAILRLAMAANDRMPMAIAILACLAAAAIFAPALAALAAGARP